MYSMWNDDYSSIWREFYKNNGNYGNKKPFSFYTGNNELRQKFKIEELDSLTSSFTSEVAFVKALANSKYRGKYIKGYPITPIIMTKRSNGNLSLVPIIYNDKFINKTAIELRNKKRNKKTNSKEILIDNSDELQKFIGYVKSLAINHISKSYLLDPMTLPEYIDLRDKEDLNEAIKSDIVGKNGIVINGTRGLLKEFVNCFELIKEAKKNNQSTLELEEYQNDIDKRLLNNFRSSYHNIRDIVVWEEICKTILERKLNKENCTYEDQVRKFFCYIDSQKKYRNEKISEDEWEYQHYIFSNNIEINKPSKRFVQNDKMRQLFENGGYEAVMENMDADEIYSNMDDLETLGIVKTNKKVRKW